MKFPAGTYTASLLLLLAASGCSEASSTDPPAVETVNLQAIPVDKSPTAEAAAEPPDPALFRAYGPSDMALQTCVKRDKSGAIVGENCPSGLVVFGPYVKIPRGATLRVAFDVQSAQKIKVTSDVVSSGGQLFHGALDEQTVNAKEARNLGYSIRMFQEAGAAEARIWVKADGPASFTITNLKLAVL